MLLWISISLNCLQDAFWFCFPPASGSMNCRAVSLNFTRTVYLCPTSILSMIVYVVFGPFANMLKYIWCSSENCFPEQFSEQTDAAWKLNHLFSKSPHIWLTQAFSSMSQYFPKALSKTRQGLFAQLESRLKKGFNTLTTWAFIYHSLTKWVGKQANAIRGHRQNDRPPSP